MQIKSLNPRLRNDLYGFLECPYCEHVQNIVNGYNDKHWHNKVLPAIHCDHCLRNEHGQYPTPDLQQRNQARRILDIPTQAQIDEFTRRAE